MYFSFYLNILSWTFYLIILLWIFHVTNILIQNFLFYLKFRTWFGIFFFICVIFFYFFFSLSCKLKILLTHVSEYICICFSSRVDFIMLVESLSWISYYFVLHYEYFILFVLHLTRGCFWSQINLILLIRIIIFL